MKVRTLKVLEASEGKWITNGEIYGKVIYLADDLNEYDFYEITDAEYEATLPKIEEGAEWI